MTNKDPRIEAVAVAVKELCDKKALELQVAGYDVDTISANIAKEIAIAALAAADSVVTKDLDLDVSNPELLQTIGHALTKTRLRVVMGNKDWSGEFNPITVASLEVYKDVLPFIQYSQPPEAGSQS